MQNLAVDVMVPEVYQNDHSYVYMSSADLLLFHYAQALEDLRTEDLRTRACIANCVDATSPNS